MTQEEELKDLMEDWVQTSLMDYMDDYEYWEKEKLPEYILRFMEWFKNWKNRDTSGDLNIAISDETQADEHFGPR